MIYSYISERNPFGISTTEKLNSIETENSLKIYASKGRIGFIDSSKIKKNKNLIGNYKVLTAFANNIGTDLSDNNLNTIISPPNTICTESYLVIGKNLMDEQIAKNISKYLKSKFVRYLISLAKANQNGTRKTYRFVPNQDFSNDSIIDWSKDIDEQLYRIYSLTFDEIKIIEEIIN